jgi:hypothetical protein
MKRLITLAAVLLAAAFALAACTPGSRSAQNQEQRQQNASFGQMITAQPLPQFTRSQLRANLVEVETAQAQGVQTTSFFFNQGFRDPIQSCTSIGAPIPTTSQLSNPQKVVSAPNSSAATIANIEPTGVYTGDSTGTYVMCIGADGKPYANYWEGFVQTVFAPATWDDKTHQVKLTGPASFKFSGGER